MLPHCPRKIAPRLGACCMLKICLDLDYYALGQWVASGQYCAHCQSMHKWKQNSYKIKASTGVISTTAWAQKFVSVSVELKIFQFVCFDVERANLKQRRMFAPCNNEDRIKELLKNIKVIIESPGQLPLNLRNIQKSSWILTVLKKMSPTYWKHAETKKYRQKA